MLAAFAFGGQSRADELSARERENLVANLAKMVSEAQAGRKSRIQQALSTLQTARSSDSAALNLYLKSVELDEFAGKEAQFREWKKSRPQLDEPGFAKALRVEYAWLALALRAQEMTEQQRAGLHGEMQQLLNSLAAQGEDLHAQAKTLEGQTGTPLLLKMYNLPSPDAKIFPAGILPMAASYQHMLAPLRSAKNLAQLRALWQQRINNEMALFNARQAQSAAGKGGIRQSANNRNNPGVAPSEAAVQLQDSLRWQMERDCYVCGDQRRAAAAMIELVKKNREPVKQVKMLEDFSSLLGVDEKAGSAPLSAPVAAPAPVVAAGASVPAAPAATAANPPAAPAQEPSAPPSDPFSVPNEVQ